MPWATKPIHSGSSSCVRGFWIIRKGKGYRVFSSRGVAHVSLWEILTRDCYYTAGYEWYRMTRELCQQYCDWWYLLGHTYWVSWDHDACLTNFLELMTFFPRHSLNKPVHVIRTTFRPVINAMIWPNTSWRFDSTQLASDCGYGYDMLIAGILTTRHFLWFLTQLCDLSRPGQRPSFVREQSAKSCLIFRVGNVL